MKDLLVVKSIVKNWYDVLLFRVGLKKPGFVMHLRNGKKIEIKKSEDYFSFWESEEGKQESFKPLNFDRLVKIIEKGKIIKFKFNNKLLRFHYDSKKQLDNTVGLIKDQFIGEQYKWLDVKGKDVIDIGANIGDTAVYFAFKGAKHIYAVEPYPYSYELAIRNIKLNRLEDKITLLNEGCSGKENVIKIDTAYKNTGGTDLKYFSKGKRIKITTLESIVKRFNINYPAILKIDCEGCEYDVLLEAQNSDLRRFKQIQIEYHYGYLNLKRKLESAGFEVNKTLPKYSFNSEAENKEMNIGYIYAERK
jgi:FkbM family methyltransferase